MRRLGELEYKRKTYQVYRFLLSSGYSELGKSMNKIYLYTGVFSNENK
jgi:hypothetical protein